MAYFAVVRDAYDDDFNVVACHVNLWALSASLKRRIFWCDVGLRLRGGAREISKLSLALPFRTEDNGVEDLSDVILEQKVAELVFGKPVRIDGSTINYSSAGAGGQDVTTSLNVLSIIRGETEINQSLSGDDFCYWTLKFARPLRHNGLDSYLRVRFHVRNADRIWSWKRTCMLKNGALVDLRVTDVRGSFVAARDWNTFRERIVTIPQLNMFVIAPSWLQPRAASPEYHYMRLFEGRVWEPYLRRLVDLKRKEKLTVFQWRNDKAKAIDSNNSYHVMLDLSDEFGVFDLKNHLIAGIVLVIFLGAVLLLRHFYYSYAVYIQPKLESLWTWAFGLKFAGVITFIWLLIWQLYRNYERFDRSTQAIRNWLRAKEERRYRKNLLN